MSLLKVLGIITSAALTAAIATDIIVDRRTARQHRELDELEAEFKKCMPN